MVLHWEVAQLREVVCSLTLVVTGCLGRVRVVRQEGMWRRMRMRMKDGGVLPGPGPDLALQDSEISLKSQRMMGMKVDILELEGQQFKQLLGHLEK
mmetsp:Transcript_22276/g.52673  ORF Transcript_22276/g.52673 Transcript_22276/m.52673 type:complete len:96 (-) Transcript_22276:417-704(-)